MCHVRPCDRPKGLKLVKHIFLSVFPYCLDCFRDIAIGFGKKGALSKSSDSIDFDVEMNHKNMLKFEGPVAKVRQLPLYIDFRDQDSGSGGTHDA